jgi:intracellular multiplication protein IcmK
VEPDISAAVIRIETDARHAGNENRKRYVNFALMKDYKKAHSYKLIRGCNLLLKIRKRKAFALAAAGVMSGIGLVMLLVTVPALAQTQLPSLDASAAAAPAAVPSEEPLGPPALGKGSEGIGLPGAAPPSSLAIGAEQIQLQAEIEAARLAAEEAKRAEEHNAKSFDRASSGLLPLSPEQIRAFMKKLEATQEAAQPPSEGPPKGEVKVSTLSLDPGVTPPLVSLAAGYVTTIDIIDATGAPWPILDVGIGGNFEVTPTQAGSHVVRVVPLTRVGHGSLSILLKDLTTPVIFRLSSGGPTYHMRYDARVPKLGPNAKTPLIQRGKAGLVAGDQVITMILENSPPQQAKRLKVAGLDARTRAWQLSDKVYVRTPLTMLSPAWNASASSPDGTTVYEIGNAPVLLMSDSGSMLRARLIREDDHDK